MNVAKTNNSHENQEFSILMIKEARTKLKQRCSRPTVPESFPQVGENLKRRCFVVGGPGSTIYTRESR